MLLYDCRLTFVCLLEALESLSPTSLLSEILSSRIHNITLLDTAVY